MCVSQAMKETRTSSAIQFNTDENEKPKEKLAADQFFSSLLEVYALIVDHLLQIEAGLDFGCTRLGDKSQITVVYRLH